MSLPNGKVITARWLYIAEWCKKRGLSPMIEENYQKAAMVWAVENSPSPTLANVEAEARLSQPNE